MPLHNDIYTLTPQIIKQKNEGLLYEKEEEILQETIPMAKTPLLTMIAAAAENNALGKDNDLIWHISDDLKRFKRLTSGHAIIMGRKTFESMPKALPNRTNIVLTNKRDYQPEGATVVHSIEDALALVKKDPQPFIIGGGEIYRLFMPYCDRIELTRVHHNFEADVFFPEIDLNQWKEIAREDINATEEQAYNYSYITFEKK
ncbi:MAG: dihydrofolate reductase [Candidatus Arcticimaribacter sp.]